jgi:predicted site-specific integrase-resolvase
MESRQDENLIPISELEKILDLTNKTINEWVRTGTIPEPMVKQGRKRYWFWWQIKQFVNKPSSHISGNSRELGE